MVSRGEEKVRVHMNVVPRSTGNTNSGTENFSRNISWCAHVSPVFPGNTVSGVRFWFANYAYATRERILTKIGAVDDLPLRCS